MLFASELRDGLASGDSATEHGLARAFDIPDVAASAIAGALNRIAGAPSSAKPALLIVVDQLEEVFSWPETRASSFLALLEGLIASGQVVILATMRSDFQHRVAAVPSLSRLAGLAEVRGAGFGERIFEISPPAHADLRQMIVRPAEAVGRPISDIGRARSSGRDRE